MTKKTPIEQLKQRFHADPTEENYTAWKEAEKEAHLSPRGAEAARATVQTLMTEGRFAEAKRHTLLAAAIKKARGEG